MDEVFPDYPDVVVGVVVVDCANSMTVATFWSELLGRDIVTPDDRWVNLVWSPRFAVGMSFQRVPEPKVGKTRLHLDIFCTDVEATAGRVEELGGRRTEGYAGTALVMLDPENNEFCLIPWPGG
jgi:predicted enzyme related to lactoylglutathione lyase